MFLDTHTIKMINNIIGFLNLFKSNKIAEKELMCNLESILGAIEDINLKRNLSNFIVKIEESIYLYYIQEGKEFLKYEIKKFEKTLENK